MGRQARRFVVAAALAALIAVITGRIEAQELSPPVIAVIAYEDILLKSVATRAIQEQLKARRTTYEAELTAKKKEIQDASQELTRQRAILSPEAFREKQRQLEARVVEIQRYEEILRRQLVKAYTEAIGEVRKEMEIIIAELAEERGFTLALPRSQVVYTSDAFVLSEEVSSRLDRRLPHVEVQFSEN